MFIEMNSVLFLYSESALWEMIIFGYEQTD